MKKGFTLITSKDITIIQALQNHPLKSFWALSEVINLSAPTIKKRYTRLLEVFPNGFDIEGIIHYEKIGMKIIDVFFALNKVKDAAIVEKILKRHNYIKYIGHCIGIGANSGLFAQFTIPNNAIKAIEKFCKILLEQRLIQSYQLNVQSNYRISCPPDLNAWDPSRHQWNISSEGIMQGFQQILTQTNSLPVLTIPIFDLKKIKKEHLIILEELSFNARRSTRQIYKDRKTQVNERASTLELDSSLTSFIQAMKEVDPTRSDDDRENFEFSLQSDQGLIIDYRLNYSSKIFSIFDTCIFKGKFNTPEIGFQVFNLLSKSNPFKIRMNFVLYENGEFLWYIPIPSQFFTVFKDAMVKYLAEDFAIIWLNYGSTDNFAFWPDNFDFTEKKWKTDEDYLIKEPLQYHLDSLK